MPFSLSCDYLNITNEKNENFGKYCGSKIGRTVFVTGEIAVMTFHADYSFQRRGFLLFLTPIPIGK